MLLSKNPRNERLIRFFESGVTRAFWKNVKDFLVSVDLMEAFGLFRKNKCLLTKERRRYFSHCLLLAIWPYQRVTVLTRLLSSSCTITKASLESGFVSQTVAKLPLNNLPLLFLKYLQSA